MSKRRNHELIIKVPDKPGTLGIITTELGKLDLQIKNIQMKSLDESWKNAATAGVVELRIKIRSHNHGLLVAALEKIAILPNVLWIESSYISNPEVRSSAAHKFNGPSYGSSD